MSRRARYVLFALACATLVMTVLAPSAGAADRNCWGASKADVVYLNGNIYTVDKHFHRAQAMAIKGDRFLAVGNNHMMNGFIGRRTTVIDLKGKTVLPGIIESHMHFLSEGEAWQQLDCFWKPKQDILDLVAAAAAAAQPGEWIQGQGWNQAIWTPAVFPTAQDLDAVAPDVPVVLWRVDGHAAWVNTKVMEIAGITDTTPNPDGGEIVRDAQGHATGILVDAAMGLIWGYIPVPTERQEIEAAKLAQAELFSYGITTCVDQGSGESAINLMKKLYGSGDLKIRVQQMVSVDDAPKFYDVPRSQRVGLFGNRYTINGVKILEDGALGSRGAWLLADYSDRPGWTGIHYYEPEQLYAMVKEARLHGFQVGTHAIGDAANRAVLDAYERVEKELPRLNKDPRFRIEHAQVVALSDIPRFKRLHVIPSMQAVHATSDKNMAELRVGPQRIKGAYAWRKFLNTGVVIADGSDAPVELVNPYHGLYAAVTRMDRSGQPPGGWYPEEDMTRVEALRSFTIWGAYASFTEKLKGSIERNKLADFVVVDRDYMSCPAMELKDITALMTVLGGETVFTAPGFSL